MPPSSPPYPVPALPNYFLSSLNQTLAEGGGDTSIMLGTIYTLDGQVVDTADFSTFGRGILTIDPLNLNSTEFASFTGITATTVPTGTVTGVLRGLSYKGNNQITANQNFHVVGAPVLIAFGTHNIIDIVALINNTYSTLYSLIESAIITGALDATQTQTGITRLNGPSSLPLGTCTISEANPAVITVSNTLTASDEVQFSTTGTLPSPLNNSTHYYVLASGLSTSSFEISLTPGGTPISTLGSTQTGTQSVTRVTPYAQVALYTPAGIPIVSSYVLASSYTPVTSSSSTTTTILATIPIPGNILGTTNLIKGRIYLSTIKMTASQSFGMEILYGGTSVCGQFGAFTQSGQSTTGNSGYCDFTIFAAGATNSQSGIGVCIQGQPTDPALSSLGSSVDTSTGTATIDSTVSQNLVIQVVYSAVSSSNLLTMDGYVIEVN